MLCCHKLPLPKTCICFPLHDVEVTGGAHPCRVRQGMHTYYASTWTRTRSTHLHWRHWILCTMCVPGEHTRPEWISPGGARAVCFPGRWRRGEKEVQAPGRRVLPQDDPATARNRELLGDKPRGRCGVGRRRRIPVVRPCCFLAIE